jgi:hypothetical protein
MENYKSSQRSSGEISPNVYQNKILKKTFQNIMNNTFYALCQGDRYILKPGRNFQKF